ncbi:hypothetical protein BBJ28_00024464 [Nothophytophthora sp. Chile5]|nr:hypothetical protein BBJ28_00024464 [Nothophytophthora sp. Chile5]
MELEHDDIFVEETRLVGNQDFVEDTLAMMFTKACANRFHFFRRNLFCHPCCHMVYGKCPQLYEVEARADKLRCNHYCLQCDHYCLQCDHRVVFDNEDLLEALGLAVVMTDDALWYNDD